jgi:branched-chain amino acid transport system substrate-binding protein
MNSKVSRRTLLSGIASTATAAGFLPQFTNKVLGAAPSGDPIIIGHQCELTGWDAATGYWRNLAATKLCDWVNQNGGIAGRPVKLVTVDTKSDVDVGVNELRHLMLKENVDVVIGSELSSVALASAKLANENKTLYLTMSTGAVTTSGPNAMPYQFRLTTNSAAESIGASRKYVDIVGKKWTILFVDYAWGQSERDWWTKGINAAGGEVVGATALPMDAQDLFPYIGQLDPSVDGIYIPVLNTLQVLQTIRSAGLAQKIVLAGLSFSLFDYRELREAGKDVYGTELAPVRLQDMPDTHMPEIYKALGIDDNGVEAASGNVAGSSMLVGIAQTLGFLKENIEKSGWKSKTDTAALIKHAEGVATYAKGPLFPMGDVTMRPQDHQAFMDIYLVRVQDGQLVKSEVVPRDLTFYDADVDLTKAG